MASLRKKYAPQFGSPDKDDGPPVMAPPSGGDAKLPPAAEVKPVEPMVESNPAEEAGEHRLRDELRKMDRAEASQREQQQPPRASEPQQQRQPPAMPAHVQEWLSRHPQYTDPNDRIAQLEINLATEKCVRDGLTWNDDDFLPSIERHLGIAPKTNGQVQRPIESRPSAPPSRPVTVNRAPPRMSAPVSAPPTREAPSMRTGRPVTYRAPLTPAQREAAHYSGVSEQEYAENLARMDRMKQAGELQ